MLLSFVLNIPITNILCFLFIFVKNQPTTCYVNTPDTH